MKRLTFDDVRDALPDLDELRPLLDHVLSVSQPDESRAWARSGQLGTHGGRLVAPEALAAEVESLSDGEARHLHRVYEAVATALRRLGAGDGAGAARAFLDVAALEEARERNDRAEAYALAALRAARESGDSRARALAGRRAARAARALGRLSAARSRYREAFDVAQAVSDARGAAEAAVGLGNVLEEQGRWPEAAEWYRAALDAVDAVEGRVPERWHALVNLHIVERSRGALEESLTWLRRAEQEASVDPDAARPFLENAKGQYYMSTGAFDLAEEHLRGALEATDQARARVTIRLNLAESLLARGRTLQAAEQARLAERDAIRARLLPRLPEVYRLLGRVAAAEGDPNAFVLFERALEVVRERDLPRLEEAVTLQAYAEAEVGRGEPERARELSEAATRLFEELGIAHRRRAWADVYAPDPDPKTTDSPNATER